MNSARRNSFSNSTHKEKRISHFQMQRKQQASELAIKLCEAQVLVIPSLARENGTELTAGFSVT